MFRFQLPYFLVALVLFLIEISIAYYWNDSFIRPIVGDFLVVIMIFCSLKSCLNLPTFPLALGVLLFAYTIEGLQALHLLEYLSLQDNWVAHIILGSTFDWRDLLAYTLGVGLVILIDPYFA